MELLKNFTLTEGSHKFVFIPYQENMDIRQVLAQTKKQKPHRIVWLKNLFTQSGCEWLDYLAEHINLRVADLRNGDGYITAVATVKELRSIIQNAYKQQLLRQRETENIVEELKAIPTEKVLILITTGRLDYTTLEETVLREQFDNTLRNWMMISPKQVLWNIIRVTYGEVRYSNSRTANVRWRSTVSILVGRR